MSALQKFITRVSDYGLGYVMKVILKNKIYRPLGNGVMKIGFKLWGNIPLKDTIIIESHNDFDVNGGAFYQYLIDNHYNDKYKIVWLIKNKIPRKLPKNVLCYAMFRPSFRKTYHICTAKYITYDDIPIQKMRQEQKMIYLNHGSFAIKSVKGKIVIPEYTNYYVCPSEQVAPIVAEQYMFPHPNPKEVYLGYPIHDCFYTEKEGDLHKLTQKKYDKVIMWMPTFRKPIGFERNDSNGELPLGIPLFENMEQIEQLNIKFLEKNVLLIIKIHPMQDMTKVKVKGLSNIMVLDGISVKNYGVDNYKLMKDADALITDYSSSAYDFLHKDRPIAYTFDDLDDYNAGFVVDDPKTLMAGHFIYQIEDFIQFIECVLRDEDPYQKERHELFDYIFKYHDGNSSQRVADFLGLER